MSDRLRTEKNAALLKRLRLACEVYALGSVWASFYLESSVIAVSGIGAVSLGIGLIVGAWLTEAGC